MNFSKKEQPAPVTYSTRTRILNLSSNVCCPGISTPVLSYPVPPPAVDWYLMLITRRIYFLSPYLAFSAEIKIITPSVTGYRTYNSLEPAPNQLCSSNPLASFSSGTTKSNTDLARIIYTFLINHGILRFKSGSEVPVSLEYRYCALINLFSGHSCFCDFISLLKNVLSGINPETELSITRESRYYVFAFALVSFNQTTLLGRYSCTILLNMFY